MLLTKVAALALVLLAPTNGMSTPLKAPQTPVKTVPSLAGRMPTVAPRVTDSMMPLEIYLGYKRYCANTRTNPTYYKDIHCSTDASYNDVGEVTQIPINPAIQPLTNTYMLGNFNGAQPHDTDCTGYSPVIYTKEAYPSCPTTCRPLLSTLLPPGAEYKYNHLPECESAGWYFGWALEPTLSTIYTQLHPSPECCGTCSTFCKEVGPKNFQRYCNDDPGCDDICPGACLNPLTLDDAETCYEIPACEDAAVPFPAECQTPGIALNALKRCLGLKSFTPGSIAACPTACGARGSTPACHPIDACKTGLTLPMYEAYRTHCENIETNVDYYKERAQRGSTGTEFVLIPHEYLKLMPQNAPDGAYLSINAGNVDFPGQLGFYEKNGVKYHQIYTQDSVSKAYIGFPTILNDGYSLHYNDRDECSLSSIGLKAALPNNPSNTCPSSGHTSSCPLPQSYDGPYFSTWPSSACCATCCSYCTDARPQEFVGAGCHEDPGCTTTCPSECGANPTTTGCAEILACQSGDPEEDEEENFAEGDEEGPEEDEGENPGEDKEEGEKEEDEENEEGKGEEECFEEEGEETAEPEDESEEEAEAVVGPLEEAEEETKGSSLAEEEQETEEEEEPPYLGTDPKPLPWWVWLTIGGTAAGGTTGATTALCYRHRRQKSATTQQQPSTQQHLDNTAVKSARKKRGKAKRSVGTKKTRSLSQQVLVPADSWTPISTHSSASTRTAKSDPNSAVKKRRGKTFLVAKKRKVKTKKPRLRPGFIAPTSLELPRAESKRRGVKRKMSRRPPQLRTTQNPCLSLSPLLASPAHKKSRRS